MLVPNPHRAQWPAKVMPALPLITVTLFAGFGQVLAGVGVYTPPGWDPPVRILVAIGIAIGLEMIAVYVQWHAHDALLLKATATAARLRRVSYLIAAAVATFQYSHFANDWAPTASAVVFAAFSASSPWLWGLHTRRAQHLQLLREGHADAGGATFSAERWRAFPLRTWSARRWSIDHSVTNPRDAWEGYRTARASTVSADQPQEAKVAPESETIPAGIAPTPTTAARPDLRIAPAKVSTPTVRAAVADGDAEGKARALAANGVGRPTIMRETGLKDNVVKAILAETKANG